MSPIHLVPDKHYYSACGLFWKAPQYEGIKMSANHSEITCRACKKTIANSRFLGKHFDVLNEILFDSKMPRPVLIRERISEYKQPIWACAYFSLTGSSLRPTRHTEPAIVIHNGYKKPFMLKGLMLHEMLHYEKWLNNPDVYNCSKKPRIIHPKAFGKRLTKLVSKFKALKPRLKIHRLI